MLHQHHGDARIGHLAHQLIDFDGFLRVQARCGLIQKDDAWPQRQRTGNFQPFQGSVRHAVSASLDVFLQTHKAHQFRRLFAQFSVTARDGRKTQRRFQRIAVQPQVSSHHHVLQGAHVHADLQVLKRAGNAAPGQFVRRFSTDGFTVQQNGATGGGVNPGDQVEQGGLARTIGADDGIDNARLNAETDVLYRLDTTKLNAELLDFKECHAQAALPNLAASVGTRPRGMKIMKIIRMAPKATVSQPSKVASACGSAVSSTAPTKEP